MRDLKYLLAYTGPLLVALGLYWGGWWTFGFTLEAFFIIPFLELVLPRSKANIPEKAEEKRSNLMLFDLLLIAHLPILYALLFWYFYQLSNGVFSGVELLGMTLSMGILLGGFGINIAHELGHRKSSWERLMAKALLLPNLYMHFIIEHNRGHHKNVATDADPASARLGEVVYTFWFRSVIGSYRNAWKLEAQRLEKSGMPSFHYRNEMIRFQLLQMAYLLTVGWFFGGQVLGFAILVAIIGFLLLESVNYIEHYGLRRKKLENGRYERVQMQHSWNSNHELGRIFLYELTRHADHHYKASRKYQILRHFDESPQLPMGYPAAILLALLPPFWFKTMDPLVHEQTSKPTLSETL